MTHDKNTQATQGNYSKLHGDLSLAFKQESEVNSHKVTSDKQTFWKYCLWWYFVLSIVNGMAIC